MALYFAKSTGGFYDDAIHGARVLAVPDPAWQRPLIDVTLQPGESYFDGLQVVSSPGPDPLILTDAPDWSMEQPVIEVANPECKIPADAVSVTPEEHAALLEAQSAGKTIGSGEDGRPFAADPPPEAVAAAKARALVLLRATRGPIIAVLDGLQGTASSKGLAALLAGDTATAAGYSSTASAVETLKQGLKDAPTAIDFSACTTFDEMCLAGRVYFGQLVDSAPADIRAKFGQDALAAFMAPTISTAH